VLSDALKRNEVRNPIAYLHSLITASRTGILTIPPQPVKQKTGEDYVKETQQRLKQADNAPKIDNANWAETMQAQYGKAFKGL